MKTSPPVPALLLTLLLFPLQALRAEDGALHFDGVDDYLEVPNFHTLGVTDEVTVEFWAKADVLKQQAAFMLSPDVATNRFQASISYNSGGNMNTYWDFGDIGAGGRVFTPNPSGTVTNWTHYAFVASQSGNVMKILVNGQQVVSDATFNAFETTVASALRIGGSNGFFFDGSLDEFRVWNVARSQAEIQRDLGGPLRGDEPGLRLYFKFDNDGTGNAANNSATATGAARHGVPGGNPAWRATPARTTYVVTNANDNGPGSLRDTLATAATESGPALITFDSGLSGGTITLTSGQFNLADNGGVTIDASGLPGGLTLSGGDRTQIFSIGSGTILSVKNVALTQGNYGDGGAIINDGTLTLTQCTLSDNAASAEGGAIFNDQNGTLALTQCTLFGNSAIFGGAILNTGVLTLTQCTLAGNLAINAGGAVFNYGVLLLSNSIVAGNGAFALNGGDIFNTGANGQASIIRAGANIVQSLLNESGATDSGPAAINLSPLLAPLADNGGPTPTMALLPGSPALDAATPIPGLGTDQRGFPRNRDGDDIAGAAPDIGAYEAQAAPTAEFPNPIVVTTPNDELDPVGEPGAGLSLREALRGAPGGATVTFDPALSGSTCTLSADLGELVPRLDVTVDSVGLPAGVTLSGNDTSRLFFVPSGRTVVLRALTLTGGNGAGADTPLHGGACFNRGSLTLERCTLTENHALYGGAFFNESGGTLTLSQCTLTANGRAASTLEAGALYNRGTAFLTHCTIVQNSAGNYGGILNDNNQNLTLTNSIVADNHGGAPRDFLNRPSATLDAAGRNFIADGVTGGFIGGASGIYIGGIDPRYPFLAPLGNYGGPTQTMALLPGSVERNFAEGSTISRDQRGFPIVDTPDIGAYEAGTLAPNYQAYIWESLPATASVDGHDGAVDYDGDGASNEAEWAALTHPADAQDFLRLTAAAFSAPVSNITFTTKSGVNYRVQVSNRPGDGWVSVGPLISGTGNPITVPVSTAETATPAYRVAPSSSPMVELAMVTVGNPNNEADTSVTTFLGNSGAVAYEYKIGKYEVTNGEYCTFLNAVDPSGQNLLALYNAALGSSPLGGITFTAGNTIGAKYAVKVGFANKPVVLVSFYDAMRFCNWLHNGGQAGGDTENGAYTLLGNSATPSNGDTVTRNEGAKFAVPSEDEWYKAAYHQPQAQGGDSDSYWLYPTRSNSEPSAVAPPGTAPAANFSSIVGSVTAVGAYTTTVGFYGTYDMAGNVWEWEDTIQGGSSRVLRGGSWSDLEFFLLSGLPSSVSPDGGSGDVGFRVSSP